MLPPKKSILKCTSVLILLIMAPNSAWADNKKKQISTVVEKAFQPLQKRYEVPGIAVGLTIKGKRYLFTYGVSSKKTKKPITNDTLFEIGSVSKIFTAILTTYAQIQNKLKLSDHPSQHLPSLRGSFIDKATLLNLGTYTAGGLPLQFPRAVTNNSKMEAYFKKWIPTTPPNVQRRYSNPSIGLLGHVTSTAMKRDFNELVEKVLFPKLGLTTSYIRVPAYKMSRYSWGHNKANKPTRMSSGVFDSEAYGVKSSISDMVRFIEVNIQPDSLDEEMRNAVNSTHIGYFKTGDMTQGLGWEQYPYPISLERLLAGNSRKMVLEANDTEKLTPPKPASKSTLFSKTGATFGFGAYAAFVPSEQVGIVMLANKNFPTSARITAVHTVLTQILSMQ